MSSQVLTVYLGVVYSFLFLVCVSMVYYYAETGFPWHTYVTLVIGYYAAFGILLLVPIDISCCVLDRRSSAIGSYEPYNEHVDVLSAGYNAFFTIILVFGSVVLVFEEYYNTDGFFTIGGRLSSAFYRMFVDTITSLVGGIIVMAVLLGQNVVPNNSAVLTLAAVIVTNTVYEMFLVFLLAYGLVEFPRRLWNIANLDYRLLLTQMDATYDYKAISDYKVNIQEDISKINYFKQLVNASSEDPSLQNALQVLQEDCPPEFRSQRQCSPEDAKKYLTKSGQVTLAGLARLRTDLKISKNRYRVAQAKVQTTQLLAYNLEDIIAARLSGNNVIHWSLKNTDSTPFEYSWHTVYKPYLYKFAAVFAAVWSIFSFLGAISCMHGVDARSSVYFQAVHGPTATGAGIAIFILFTLGYASYVTMWSLFQMQFAGMMVLVPFSTAPEGLSFNVRMVARLAAPLVFFYLGWLAESGIDSGPWTSNNAPSIIELVNVTYSNVTVINNTTSIISNYTVLQNQTISQSIFMPSSFSNFYQLQKVKIIEQTFGTLFPVVLIILVPLFATNLLNRFFVLIKMDSCQFGTPIPTEEQLRGGKRQLAKYRKLAERGGQRTALRTYLTNLQKSKASGVGGMFSFLFTRKGSQAVSQDEGDVEAPRRLREPEALAGPLEKKGAAHMGMGAKWKDAYAEIRAPGVIHFFKDAAAASSTKPSKQSDPFFKPVDLRLVLNFITPIKKGDAVQLDLELPEEVIKLRFKTEVEQERWKSLLLEWKDFANDFADLYPGGAADDASAQQNSSSSTSSQGNAKPAPSLPAKKFKSSADAALAALDSIVVEDVEEGIELKEKPAAFNPFKRGGLFGSKPSAPAKVPEPEPEVDPRPSSVMQGWLEKKKHSTLSNEWSKRYCRIDDTSGSFKYFKSNKASEKPLTVLDLREVSDVIPYEKGGKADPSRFNIDMGEKVYKFRAPSEAEGQEWVDNLTEWREYFLMQAK